MFIPGFVECLVVVHVAHVATAVDTADAAGVELQERDVVHLVAVVAAEEEAHVVEAVVGGVAFVLRPVAQAGMRGVGQRGIGVDEVAVHEGFGELGIGLGEAVVVVHHAVAEGFHNAFGIFHRGAVAAHEGGVHLAAVEGHRGVAAGHLVAAAEEVADAIVAPRAAEIGVVLVVCIVGELGAVHREVGLGSLGHGAAVVVAAEDCQDGAAVDVDR